MLKGPRSKILNLQYFTEIFAKLLEMLQETGQY